MIVSGQQHAFDMLLQAALPTSQRTYAGHPIRMWRQVKASAAHALHVGALNKVR
jgi:hypothetical protein